MEEVIKNLPPLSSVLITAPPGFGKTYRTLKAINRSEDEYVFVFPLRALCDEVYIKSLEFGISTLNLRSSRDIEQISLQRPKLIVCTCELGHLIGEKELYRRIVILDEFHLFYYWGESFKQIMLELFFKVGADGGRMIMLSATISESIKEKLLMDLNYNYEQIFYLNFGNQKLKNHPHRIYFYPQFFKAWMHDDLMTNSKGVKLVFCQYRKEVGVMAKALTHRGFNVLSCVGGEAKEFCEKLNENPDLDYIVATSVVSHGVNLPNIQSIYFLYKVNNLDFYLQMIGRGGREGQCFECHVMNTDYFKTIEMVRGVLFIFFKRLINKVKNLIYYAYEC